MARFILKTGRHRQGTKTFKAGDVVEDDRPLNKMFPNTFRKALSAEDEELDEEDAIAIEKHRRRRLEAKKKRNLEGKKSKKKRKDKEAKKSGKKKSRKKDDE